MKLEGSHGLIIPILWFLKHFNMDMVSDIIYELVTCQCRYRHPSINDQFLLLHCMLCVSLDQLHSIRVMDHLMVVAYYTFSLMFFTCWPIFIHLDHLQSFLSLNMQKSLLGFTKSHQVQGFINKVFKMINNGQDAHEEVK